MEKRRNCSSFPQYFQYVFNSGVKLHIHLLTVAVRFIVFLNSANLICRGMDISKCFRESLGIRDNESRLYSSSVFYVLSLLVLLFWCLKKTVLRDSSISLYAFSNQFSRIKVSINKQVVLQVK